MLMSAVRKSFIGEVLVRIVVLKSDVVMLSCYEYRSSRAFCVGLNPEDLTDESMRWGRPENSGEGLVLIPPVWQPHSKIISVGVT